MKSPRIHVPAVADSDRARLTPAYSYRLMTNFAAHSDYANDLRRASKPVAVLVGSENELLYAERFPAAIHEAAPTASVQVVPGVGHIGMTTDPRAIQAVSAALRLLPSR